MRLHDHKPLAHQMSDGAAFRLAQAEERELASLVEHCSAIEREAAAVAQRCMELREQHDRLVAAEAEVGATHAKVSGSRAALCAARR